jgi:crotonobetainyl-CoA:carnitine CoA-transferase CaiB-like acyl-CoA transferase
MEELFEVDQYKARGAFGTIAHPLQGDLTAPMTPFKLYNTPALAGGTAPRFGADTRRRLADVGVDSAEFDRLRRANVVAGA